MKPWDRDLLDRRIKDYANFCWEIFKTAAVIAFAIFVFRLTGWI
jgi:hypothetical protein